MAISQRAPALTFRNTEFSIIDRNGQRWLKATDIARALGYARQDKISQIFSRHRDEFTPTMADTLKLRLSGNLETETQIFSLRGAHLLAMFARTPVAAEFRRWVLDILDLETLPPTDSNPGLLNLAFSLAAEATSQVSRTVFEAVMAGKDDWRHDRWLLALNWNGADQPYQPVVQSIPRDAAVMTQGQYLRAMTEGNGLYVSTPELSQFIESATKKLAHRCAFYEGQAAGKAMQLES